MVVLHFKHEENELKSDFVSDFDYRAFLQSVHIFNGSLCLLHRCVLLGQRRSSVHQRLTLEVLQPLFDFNH